MRNTVGTKTHQTSLMIYFPSTKRRGKTIKKEESLKDFISKKFVEKKRLEDLEESNRISSLLVLPWWMRIIIDRQM